MDRLEELTTIVRRAVADYNNARDWKAKGYYLEDTIERIYAIIIIPDHDHPLVRKPHIMMMARVVGEKVVIDEDTTDRPLYEELLRCGIPRERIVLAYAGEKSPALTPS